MVKLEVEKLSLRFPEINWALQDCSFQLSNSTFNAIVGPSGSGKTTLLRLIAGLETPEAGSILFNGRDITQLPAHERDIGFVFQSDALFPHLDVYGNVAFGLHMHNVGDITGKVAKALDLVHLGGFEKRRVTELSGGERKRVAIARAIAFEPALLLLDEPFNGLDANLKEKMKLFLKELQERTDIMMLLVTHDLDDAFFLSDHMVLMNNGKIEQLGTPVELFQYPKNEFVAGFFSDYLLAEGITKVDGDNIVGEVKFQLPVKKGKGRLFVNFKKTNYKFA